MNITTFCEKLKNYAAKYLFVGDLSSRQTTLRIRPVYKHPCLGKVKLNLYYLDLPITNPVSRFYVFMVLKNTIKKSNHFSATDWTRTDRLKGSSVDVKIYDEDGRKIPSWEIYIHELFHYYVVAISEDAFAKTLRPAKMYPILSNTKELYMTIANEVGVKSHEYITGYTPRTVEAIDMVRASVLTAALVFVGGIPVQNTSMAGTIRIGDFVEALTYTNACIVTTTIDGSTGVYVDSYGKDHQIIHIPKSANPTNVIMSYDMCELYVFKPYDSQNLNTNFGYWIPKVVYADSLKQLTHNDISIPMSVLAPYAAKLNVPVNNLVVKTVHRMRFDKTMLRSAEYVDLLYKFNDSEIMDYMTGNATTDVEFWHADVLQDSEYASMINNIPEAGQSTFIKFVKSFGYYHSIALTCPRVQHFTVSADSPHRFEIPIPLTFNENLTKAHVFLGGEKVHDTLVATKPLIFTQNPIIGSETVPLMPYNGTVQTDHHLVVDIDPSVQYITPSDEEYKTLSIELFEDTSKNNSPDVVFFFVTDGVFMTIPFNKEIDKLYRREVIAHEPWTNIIEHSAHPAGFNKYTWDYQYVEVPEEEYLEFYDDINRVLSFAPGNSFTNNTYIVQPGCRLYRFEFNFDTAYNAFDPIVIDLVSVDTNNILQSPILDIGGSLVYLNGRALVKGVDYDIITQLSSTDNVVWRQLVVQNERYIRETNNKLEAYVYRDIEVSNEYGFAQPELPFGIKTNLEWYHNNTMVVDDGYSRSTSILPFDAWLNGVYTSSAPNHGSLINCRLTVPMLLQWYFDSIELTMQEIRESDASRVASLINLVDTESEALSDAHIIIPESHNIYSVFVLTLVRDLIKAIGLSTNSLLQEWINQETTNGVYSPLETYSTFFNGSTDNDKFMLISNIQNNNNKPLQVYTTLPYDESGNILSSQNSSCDLVVDENGDDVLMLVNKTDTGSKSSCRINQEELGSVIISTDYKQLQYAHVSNGIADTDDYRILSGDFVYETIDTSAGADNITKAFIKLINGQPVVVYAFGNSIKCATFNGNTWDLETVCSGLTLQGFDVLNDKPIVLVYAIAATMTVSVIIKEDGIWTTEEVVVLTAPTIPSMAVVGDNVYVLFKKDNVLKYKIRNGLTEQWTAISMTLDPTNSSGAVSFSCNFNNSLACVYDCGSNIAVYFKDPSSNIVRKSIIEYGYTLGNANRGTIFSIDDTLYFAYFVYRIDLNYYDIKLTRTNILINGENVSWSIFNVSPLSSRSLNWIYGGIGYNINNTKVPILLYNDGVVASTKLAQPLLDDLLTWTTNTITVGRPGNLITRILSYFDLETKTFGERSDALVLSISHDSTPNLALGLTIDQENLSMSLVLGTDGNGDLDPTKNTVEAIVDIINETTDSLLTATDTGNFGSSMSWCFEKNGSIESYRLSSNVGQAGIDPANVGTVLDMVNTINNTPTVSNLVQAKCLTGDSVFADIRTESVPVSLSVNEYVHGMALLYWVLNVFDSTTTWEEVLERIRPWLYIRDLDIVFKEQLDLNFIDVYPSWCRFDVEMDNIRIYEFIDTIIRNTIDNDPVTDGDIGPVGHQ